MSYPDQFIKFLGTAGARFVMIRQLRASGGIWVGFKGKNILIDPGPGSLVAALKSRPALCPEDLDAIILTHRHLDHSNDLNVMVEAMTRGGFKKRGVVYLPSDCVSDDPVFLKYFRALPRKIVFLKPRTDYSLGSIRIRTSQKLIHPATTFGFNIYQGKIGFSLIPDTKYFQGLEDNFKNDCVIINTVFLNSLPNIEHLCAIEAEKIVGILRPRLTVLTHFGMSMTRNASGQALRMMERLKTRVIAAEDGRVVDLKRLI